MDTGLDASLIFSSMVYQVLILLFKECLFSSAMIIVDRTGIRGVLNLEEALPFLYSRFKIGWSN